MNTNSFESLTNGNPSNTQSTRRETTCTEKIIGQQSRAAGRAQTGLAGFACPRTRNT